MILKHPITGRETHAEPAEWLHGCAYFRCPKTGLEWLDPLPEGAPVFPDFSSYADEFLASATTKSLHADMPPNERSALKWALKQLPQRARIVELFAESGRFAWALRSQGFEVLVADPVAAHVRVLRKHGFEGIETADPSKLPSAWSNAAAVVILESIVRLPDPASFMASVKSQFPGARVFISAPSMRRPLKIPGVVRRAGHPPDFLTRWTVPALCELLQNNGYAAQGFRITPGMLSTHVRRTWRNFAYVGFLAGLMLLSGEYEFSVAASGTPRQEPRP